MSDLVTNQPGEFADREAQTGRQARVQLRDRVSGLAPKALQRGYYYVSRICFGTEIWDHEELELDLELCEFVPKLTLCETMKASDRCCDRSLSLAIPVGNCKRAMDCPFAERRAALLHNVHIGKWERFSMCRLDLGTRHFVYSGALSILSRVAHASSYH
jgi:hypothetical protein